MKAVILEDTRRIVVRQVPDAEMRETTDVLLRITSTAICGTDLHFYEGRMRGIEGGIIGHEPLLTSRTDDSEYPGPSSSTRTSPSAWAETMTSAGIASCAT